MDDTLSEAVMGEGDLPGKPHSAEQCVPTSALEMDGVAPAEGDAVEFTVKGTVTRSADGKTYVKATEVNGQPVAEEAEEAEEEPEEMSDDDIMAKAKKSDDHDAASITA